jgi:phosphoesterase RecJ-like protein
MIAPHVLGAYPLSRELKEAAEKLKSLATKSKGVLISSTLTSDGDSIGSQIGVYALLKHWGLKDEQIWIVNESPVPQRYSFLKHSERILTLSQWEALSSKPLLDLGVTCDGGVERTGEIEPLFRPEMKTVLVDHHAVGSSRIYDCNLLDLQVSSTCELVYLLCEYFEVPLTPELAEALYIGMVFDTGFFKHSITTPKTHHVAARLISTGIDFSKISDRAILERSWEAQLLLKALLENIESFAGGKIIVSHWTHDQLKRIHFKDGDQEGMINQLYYTESASVVVLITERDDGKCKISFRSKGQVNVAELARRLNPDGGGHIRASGCMMPGSVSQVQRQILDLLTPLVR